MAVLSSLLLGLAGDVTVPGGLWQWLILNVFDFVADYGWRIVLFTLILKVVVSPLDIYQRVAMKKNQRITERLKPEIEKIERQYAGNPQALQQKKSELNKREGVKMAAGCLPMLLTTALSFYLLMGGLNPISQYKNMVQYLKLYDAYTAAELSSYSRENDNDSGIEYFIIEKDDAGNILSATLNTNAFLLADGITLDLNALNEYEAGAITRATDAAVIAADTAYYEETQESFLWVKNIWVTDAFWAKPVMSEAEFKRTVDKYGKDPKSMGLDMSKEEYEQKVMGSYKKVTKNLYESEKNTTNGILVLPILSIVVMVASQMLMRRLQKKSGQDVGGAGNPMANNKMMTYMMPIIFGGFSLLFTAAFSLYMITSSTVTIFISLISTLVMNKLDKREGKQQLTDDGIVRYGRPDPNAKPEQNTNKKH